MSLQYIDMDVGDVTLVNLTGRITLGEGTALFRQAIESVLDRGRSRILLNFAEIFYVDSSGLGELMHANKLVTNAGGVLKLMKLNEITRDLIQVTRLYTVFEVFPDEPSALASFLQ